MRTRIALIVIATLAACAQPGPRTGTPSAAPGAAPSAAAGASAPTPQEDVRFMRDMAYANLAEVETGKLAVARAQNPSVKRFGRRMIDDHMGLLAEGNQLALAKGMQPPTSPDARHQAAMTELQSMSGESFDRAYMELMVKDHTETVQLLQQAASQAADPRLRALAQKALPTIQQHLQMAQQLTGDIIGRAQ